MTILVLEASRTIFAILARKPRTDFVASLYARELESCPQKKEAIRHRTRGLLVSGERFRAHGASISIVRKVGELEAACWARARAQRRRGVIRAAPPTPPSAAPAATPRAQVTPARRRTNPQRTPIAPRRPHGSIRLTPVEASAWRPCSDRHACSAHLPIDATMVVRAAMGAAAFVEAPLLQRVCFTICGERQVAAQLRRPTTAAQTHEALP